MKTPLGSFGRTTALLAALICLPVILCVLPCSAADPAGPAQARPSLEEAHRAYQSLLEVQVFAFGGVGFGGITSECEKAFRTILASTNALRLLQKTLANGSNEAKLYSLCGLRHLDKPSFESASKALVAADPKVTTMVGCFVGHEKAATIVKRIADGGSDIHTSATWPRKP
jgi:hypothetical protein